MALYFIYPIFLCIVIIISACMFFKFIYTPYKLKTTKISFSELLTVLNATINTELELYEKDVFKTKGALLNSNFDNYYMDITTNIIKKLSPTFFMQMKIYLTEEAVAEVIARTVKIYLTEKIDGTT